MNLTKEIREKIDDALAFVEENKPGYRIVIAPYKDNYVMTVDVSEDGYDDSVLARLDEIGYNNDPIICTFDNLDRDSFDLQSVIHEIGYSDLVEIW